MARVRRPSRGVSSSTSRSSRAWWFLAFFLVLAAVLAARLFYVQVIASDSLSEKATELRSTSDITLSARRGTIYDRNGRVLASTVDATTIYADPGEVTDAQAAADQLAPILGEDAQELEDKLDQDSKSFVYLARKVDTSVGEQVAQLGLSGVYELDDSRRIYPNGSTGIQVLGLVNTEDEGLSGLELYYNDTLSGTDGTLRYERGLYGAPIQGGTYRVDAEDGDDITISIDLELQQQVEQTLSEAMADSKARSGNIVVYDAETGEIYASASAPLPDANDPRSSSAQALNLTAVTTSFEPGSTFKSLTMAAAVDTGTVTPDSTYTVPDHIQVDDRTIRDDSSHETEDMSATRILAVSSNVGIDLIERDLGDESFYDYLKRFGIGEETGVDFPGASSGSLSDVSDWSSVTAQNIPFGQGVSVSTLQMVRAYGALADNGWMQTPHYLVDLPDGGQMPEWVSTQVVSADTASTLTGMLEKVVTDGTGKTAAVDDYTTVGKTGTAQYRLESGEYSTDSSIVSFVGYLPNTSRKLVCSASLHSPQNGYKGTTMFSDVMTYASGRYHLAPG